MKKLRSERKLNAVLDGGHRYCNVAAAIVGSAVVGGVASSAASKSASKSAAKSNQDAIDANAYQGEIATDQYDEYKNTYRPLERALVADSQNADSAAAYNKAAGDAQSTVSSQIGLARDRLARTPGLDPSSAAAQAASANMELKGAALGATAQNQARKTVQDTAYAKKLDAVGLGKGLVSGASTGLAAASANAAAIAKNTSAQANQTASGVGSLVSGVVGGLTKVDWNNFGFGSSIGGVATNNTGATASSQMPAGLNGYADGLGGGV